MLRFFRWIGKLFTNDQTRALLLRMVAQDAAALVVAMNPKATWAELLANIIQQITGMPDPPTTSQAAIQRAAAAALVALGKVPS